MKEINQETYPGVSYCVYLTGQACGGAFQDRYCRRYYLIRFLNAARAQKVAIHAYSVLPNCAYILLTPSTSNGLNKLLTSSCEAYGEYFGTRFNRGKDPLSRVFAISEVTQGKLFMETQKFIERRPTDLGLCNFAGQYEWSSFSTNAFGCRSPSIDKHPCYRRFLADNKELLSVYREYIAGPFEPEYLDYLRVRIESGQAIAKRAVRARTVPVVKRKASSQGFKAVTRSMAF